MKFFIANLFLFISLGFYGQNDTLKTKRDSSLLPPKYFHNTISVNVSSFFEKTFKSAYAPDFTTSFLYYSYNFKKFFVRVGFSGSTLQKTDYKLQTKETVITKKYMLGSTMGTYLTKNINRNFSVGYGLNFIAAYSDSSVVYITTFDKVTNYSREKQYGFAPGLLLKYKFNKRLSLFAEYTLPAKMMLTQAGSRYSLFPEENSADKRYTSYSLKIYNPISIYLSCSF